MKIRFLLPLCSLLVAGCSSIEKSTDPERDYEILQRKQQAEAVKRFESPTSLPRTRDPLYQMRGIH